MQDQLNFQTVSCPIHGSIMEPFSFHVIETNKAIINMTNWDDPIVVDGTRTPKRKVSYRSADCDCIFDAVIRG